MCALLNSNDVTTWLYGPYDFPRNTMGKAQKNELKENYDG